MPGSERVSAMEQGIIARDELLAPAPPNGDDTSTVRRDTLRRSNSGIDTVVSYYAADSVVFFTKEKRMRLRGNANTKFRTQKLESEIIELYFDSGLMNSVGAKDSSGNVIGYPKFTDGGKEYVGAVIKYNFKSKTGSLSMGETTIDNAVFSGGRILRNADQSLFVEDGCYSTCDHPHPHFYFSSPRMKVIPGDRIFMEEVYLYVQDVPVLYLPFGLFFPNKSGRQSGLIVPRPFFDASRGVAFQNLGYYFALSDYYDTQVTVDLYSKGGYRFNNLWNYNLRYVLNGKLNLSYANVRANTLSAYSKEYKLEWEHAQVLSQQTKLNANIRLQSNDYAQNTLSSLAQRIQQNVFSSAGLSHSFENNMSLSLNYTRNQDLRAKTWDQTPSLSFSMPSFYPLKTAGSSAWYTDVALGYSSQVNTTFRHALGVTSRDSSYVDGSGVTRKVIVYDSSYNDNYSAAWRHSPTISISPKVGFFTLTPSISFGANVYARRITQRSYNATTRTTSDELENGLFWEYSVSYGLNTRTTLYGSPLNLGSFALRHTLMPSIGLSYSPDFSSNTSFYANYSIPADSLHRLAQQVRYSRFALDGGGIASQSKSLLLTFSLDNSIDAKVFGDSADTKIELARINVTGNYNFVKDSLKLSDLRWSIRTPSVANVSFTTDLGTTAYGEAPVLDTNGKATGSYRQISQFLSSQGKLPLRITSVSFYLSTSFGSTGSSGQTHPDESVQDTAHVNVGERFRRRMEYQETESDVYGENSPGYSRFAFPWNVSMSLSYSSTKPFEALAATQSLNLQSTMSFSLTPSWSVSGGLNYDFTNHLVTAPSVTIRKVIHCWALDVTWYPTGSVRGFYLSFSPLAPVLHDLKLEKRTNTYIQ